MIQLPDGVELSPGQEVLVCPGHICPTVALQGKLYVLDAQGHWIGSWSVAARERDL